ncbi:MAG: DNA cytosine methyltransferase [Bacillota bacterium]
MEFFVGAGGSHLGFQKTNNFETVLVSDINQDMCETFKHNNPEVPNVICDDIWNLKGAELLKKSNIKKKELDAMFGGVVCKGFSLAGVRSSSDHRNDLYKKYISLVKEMQPKVAIIENVPGMASMTIQNGKEFSKKKKEQINEAWLKLKKLNGLKSSIRKGLANQEQINEANEIEKNKEHYRKLIKEGSTNVIDDIKRLYLDAGYITLEPKILSASDYGAATSRKRLIIIAIRKDLNHKNFNWPKTDLKSKTVSDILKTIDYSKDDVDNEPMNHAEKSVKRFKYIPEGKNIVSVMHKVPEELKISKFYSRGCTMRLDRNKPAPTLVPGHSNFPVHPWEHRSITVREAACLMGFPSDYKFFGSHTSRCEQVGQAVVVEMAEAIAKSVKEFIDNQGQTSQTKI